MDENEDRIMQEQLRRAVRRAFRQVLKDIESEPSLIIELGDCESRASEDTMAEIRAWLFRRR